MLGTWLSLRGGLTGTRALCSHERQFRRSERARGPAVPCSLRFALPGCPLQVTVMQPVQKATRRIPQIPPTCLCATTGNRSRACRARVVVQGGGVWGFYFLHSGSLNPAFRYCSLGFCCHYLRWEGCFDFILIYYYWWWWCGFVWGIEIGH